MTRGGGREIVVLEDDSVCIFQQRICLNDWKSKFNQQMKDREHSRLFKFLWARLAMTYFDFFRHSRLGFSSFGSIEDPPINLIG